MKILSISKYVILKYIWLFMTRKTLNVGAPKHFHQVHMKHFLQLSKYICSLCRRQIHLFVSLNGFVLKLTALLPFRFLPFWVRLSLGMYFLIPSFIIYHIKSIYVNALVFLRQTRSRSLDASRTHTGCYVIHHVAGPICAARQNVDLSPLKCHHHLHTFPCTLT
jgi:hypothetical protein